MAKRMRVLRVDENANGVDRWIAVLYYSSLILNKLSSHHNWETSVKKTLFLICIFLFGNLWAQAVPDTSKALLMDTTSASTTNPTTGVKTLGPQFASTAKHDRKSNVAILEFTGSFKVFTREDIHAITNRFETELMKTDSFTVLERRNMDAILQEQGFQQTGACSSSECQVKVGQLLGVDRIITGEVSKVGDIVSMNLKMVDVEKGNNVLSHALDIKGSMQDVLHGGCYEMAQIFSGRQKPNGERSILTVEKSSVWPWIVGGLGVVAIGAGTYVVLNKDSSKRADYTVNTGF